MRRYGVFRGAARRGAVRVLPALLRALCGPAVRSGRDVQPQQPARHRAEPGGAGGSACRSCSSRTACPCRPIARLDYDLAIVECEASRRIYEDAGCRMEHVVVKSRKRDSRAMRLPLPARRLTVGLFLSKDPVEERVVVPACRLLADDRGSPGAGAAASRQPVAGARRRAWRRSATAGAAAFVGRSGRRSRASAIWSSPAIPRCCSTPSSPAAPPATSAASITARTTCRHSSATGWCASWTALEPIDGGAIRRFYARAELARRSAPVCGRGSRRRGGRDAAVRDRRDRAHRSAASTARCEAAAMRTIGIIPARMGSSRFPGKPLATIDGMPMLGHVYFRSRMNPRLDGVYIATCDEEIRRYAARDRRRRAS